MRKLKGIQYNRLKEFKLKGAVSNYNHLLCSPRRNGMECIRKIAGENGYPFKLDWNQAGRTMCTSFKKSTMGCTSHKPIKESKANGRNY